MALVARSRTRPDPGRRGSTRTTRWVTSFTVRSRRPVIHPIRSAIRTIRVVDLHPKRTQVVDRFLTATTHLAALRRSPKLLVSRTPMVLRTHHTVESRQRGSETGP